MKKLKIAITGVFDLENYGDLLFPVVFKEAMDARGLKFELYHFSVNKCKKALDDKIDVYSLNQLEKMHLKENFDTIIVGGGALIHLNKIYQSMPSDNEKFIEYDISDTWIVPSIVAAKYNIKLLWNVPGVPYDIPKEYENFVKWCCSNVDYLSVRNNYSKKVIENIVDDNHRINVYPDSVLCISNYIKKEYLKEVREKVLDINDKYIVFHCNRHIPHEDIGKVLKTLNRLNEEGYKIVLLPLAYTHNDQKILENLNELAGRKYNTFINKLNIIEMLSILQGCELYIGVSFHGAITAASYGKKVILYNYMKYNKSSELMKLLDREKYHIENANNIDDVVKSILSEEEDFQKINEIKQSCEEHFQRLANYILDTKSNYNKANKRIDIMDLVKEFYQAILHNKKYEQNDIENNYLKSKINYLDGVIKDLENKEQHYRIQSSYFENALNSTIEYKDSQIEYFKGLLKDAENREKYYKEKYLYYINKNKDK